MTPSERVALGRALEELERPKAAERKAATQLAGRAKGGEHIGAVPANGTERYDTRDVIAPAVGFRDNVLRREVASAVSVAV